MEIHIESIDHVTVIELSGELDANSAPEITKQVLSLAEAQHKILLDMEEVTYMSSAGLRMLLLLYRQITENKGEVALSSLGEEVRDTMSMTGFLDFFKTYQDRASGVEALTHD